MHGLYLSSKQSIPSKMHCLNIPSKSWPMAILSRSGSPMKIARNLYSASTVAGRLRKLPAWTPPLFDRMLPLPTMPRFFLPSFPPPIGFSPILLDVEELLWDSFSCDVPSTALTTVRPRQHCRLTICWWFGWVWQIVTTSIRQQDRNIYSDTERSRSTFILVRNIAYCSSTWSDTSPKRSLVFCNSPGCYSWYSTLSHVPEGFQFCQAWAVCCLLRRALLDPCLEILSLF